MWMLAEIFCDVDDFCQWFEPQWRQRLLSSAARQRDRATQLSTSEVITIVIGFHQSGYRTFKAYYEQHVRYEMREAFPGLVSYNRCVELTGRVLVPLCAYLHTRRGQATGLAFIDATPLAVCHNRRIHRHRVFAEQAARGRTSMGWFYGLKLHVIANERGELLAFKLTPGNVDDRTPLLQLAAGLTGKLYGDKGYISQAKTKQLAEQGLTLITRTRRNMKAALLSPFDQQLLPRRALIETIFDQLKSICQMEHTRHRSTTNAIVNIMAALVAYTWREHKPSLRLDMSMPVPI